MFFNGVICAGLLILYWSTSHLYRFTHTHMTIYTNVKFHVNAVSLMSEPEQC